MSPSLDMEFEQVDGRWMVDAPWLEEPLVADTAFEAYWAAARHRPGRGTR